MGGADAACGWLLDELEEGNPLPKASEAKDIHPEAGGVVNLLVLDDAISAKMQA